MALAALSAAARRSAAARAVYQIGGSLEMIQARAFWAVAAGLGAIREECLVPPGPDESLVHARASGVSRGTEALVFRGHVPVSQYEQMRAPLMGGAFPFPVKYGYAVAGVTDVGRRVFVLHPHQDLFVAPTTMCIPIPDAVPFSRAVLAANLETAINIFWDASPLVGERMLVVGAGAVGLLTASLLAQVPGARVTIVDIDLGRASLATHFGCTFALPSAAPGNQELIVHTSASEAGLRLALALAAYEGRIIEASWYGDVAPAVPLGEAFHAARLKIVASQVGAIAPAMRGRRTHAERMVIALDMLSDSIYDVLLEGPTSFDDLPLRMPDILRPGGLCHVITYGE